MDTVEALVSLLGAAIHGEKVRFDASSLDAEGWRKVLGAAAAQNIHTLVFDALPSGVPEEVMKIWRRQTGMVEQYNRKIASVADAQKRTWQKLGLNYAMLKGLSVAAMYPHPEHRGSGDIDWYFGDRESWDAALSLARKHASAGVHTDSDGDVNYVWNGVLIEHHKDWTHLSSRFNRRKVGAPHIVDGQLSPENVLLMLNAHILHHLSTSGIGLKQISDLAMAYEYYAGKYRVEEYVSLLNRLGLVRWTAFIHSVIQELTGVPSSALPVKPSASEVDTEKVIRFIFSGGSFGMGKSHRFFSRGGCAFLIMRYCPREVISRYWHLTVGRLRK